MLARTRPLFNRYANPSALASNAIASPNDLSAFNANFQLNAITTNATMAPDGSMTADRAVPNTTSNFHSLSHATLTTNGGNWVFRARLKPAGYQFVNMSVANNNSFTKFLDFVFDIGAGVLCYKRTATNYDGWARTTRLTNGWVLCEVYVNGVDSNSTHRIDAYISNNQSIATYSGDGVSGVLGWGFELAPVPN